MKSPDNLPSDGSLTTLSFLTRAPKLTTFAKERNKILKNELPPLQLFSSSSFLSKPYVKVNKKVTKEQKQKLVVANDSSKTTGVVKLPLNFRAFADFC